jgi:hypothetical protein
LDNMGECYSPRRHVDVAPNRKRAKEWKSQLRSSIHPLIFTTIYYIAGSIAWILPLSPLTAADLLVAAPKTAQAVIAATGDYYTWKLAGKVYGSDSYGAWATVRFEKYSAVLTAVLMVYSLL